MTRHLNAFTASLAVHLSILATLLWLSAATAREGALQTTLAAAPTSISSSLLDPATVPRSTPATNHDDRIEVPNETGSTALDIPNFAFDFGKIAARVATLFPFLTHELVFEPIREMGMRAQRGGLVNPYARVPESARRPPLAMNERSMQALVDRIWSRRHRWSEFQTIAGLSARYSATDGQLPASLRRYSEQNLLQPYVETHVRDPRLWTMLGITADHSDFIAVIVEYATTHPSTKATTELLFMLDDMAQGSRDTLLALLDIDPLKDLWWTRTRNEDAHGLVMVLQRHYRDKLAARGIGSAEGTVYYYDAVRVSILTAIVGTTPNGYRADDARFLIGSILWRNERYEEAVRWWREMDALPNNRYGETAAAIHAVVGGLAWQQVDARAIQEILDNERRKWTEFWWRRLQRFGHSLSSY